MEFAEIGRNECGEKGRLPASGERVVVRCHDFRCLAYRDAEGVWRADKRGEVLPEVLEVLIRF